MNRDEMATQIAGQMAATAIDADWIAERAYNVADALLKVRGPVHEEFPGSDIDTRKMVDAIDRSKPEMDHPSGATTDPLEDKKKHCREKPGITEKVLDALSDGQWKVAGDIQKIAGLTYAQVNYQLKKIGDQLESKLRPTGRGWMYRIAKEEPCNDRMAFAQSLGYATTAQATEDMGSWEFEKRFKEQMQ